MRTPEQEAQAKAIVDADGKVKRFACHRCVRCCTKVRAQPTRTDIWRIIKATGMSPTEFLSPLVSGELDTDRDDEDWVKLGEEWVQFSLRHVNGRCIFLKKTRGAMYPHCSIYEHRPTLCRSFPFAAVCKKGTKVIHDVKLRKGTPCPQHKDGQIPKDAAILLALKEEEENDDHYRTIRVFNAQRTPSQALMYLLTTP